MAILIIVVVGIHKAYLSYIGIGLWIFDIFFRMFWTFVQRSKVKKAQARRMDSKIVELRFDKGNFKYAAGQYVFLNLPRISFWEPHPFTISSCPIEDDVTIHIKDLGDWTSELYRICEEPQVLDVYMDGPYGNPSIEFENPKNQVFLFLSKCIGVTPMASMAKCLLDQYVRGRAIKKIHFVWSVKSLDEVYAVFSEVNILTDFETEIHNLKRTANAALDSSILKIEIYVGSLEFNNRPNGKTFAFEKYVKQGRIPLEELFKQTKKQQVENKNSNVCVLTCGREDFMNQVSWLSTNHYFSHHSENFNY